MHEQDKKFVERWEKQRVNGKWIYGLKYGAFFGFMAFLIVNLWYLKDRSFDEVFLNSMALSQLLSMILGGILGYSLLAWNLNQKNYEKIMDREKKDS